MTITRDTERKKLVERLRAGGRHGADGYIFDELPINPDGPEAAAAITSLLDEVARLREAARHIMPYLDWTIGPESPGHHPTMPSAVEQFRARTALGGNND